MTKAEAQKQTVAECKAAMPPGLELLWETILHTPDNAREGILDILEKAMPDDSSRARALLAWCGHSDGSCPVCRMLLGCLLFSLRDPIGSVVAALEAFPEVLPGASFFLGTQLRVLVARAAGLDHARLDELKAQAAALPADLKQRLRAEWSARGGGDAFSLR